MNGNYALLTLRGRASDLDHHSFAGLSRGVIASRISYTFGIRGRGLRYAYVGFVTDRVGSAASVLAKVDDEREQWRERHQGPHGA
jgi:hypothetical protein